MRRPSASWSFEAIGTVWEIALYDDISKATLAAAKQKVAACIEQFDQTYSRFRSDSLVTKVSQAAGKYEFPVDAAKLISLYKKLYDVTHGAVTPLIGQTIADAGYDASYSLQPKAVLRRPASWESVLSFRANTLTTEQPVLLDFGAAGKGYLIDIVSTELLQVGVDSFYVDAGGDIAVRGTGRAVQVGLEHPTDPEQVIGAISVCEGAICGSAGNRRAWQDYTHIIDPFTLRSPRHISATWCMAADALTADGLATALYFVSPQVLHKAFDFEYCIVYADGMADYSQGFRAGMFQDQQKVMI